MDDLAEVALVLGSVGACGQLAIYGGLRQQNRIGDQRVDGLDAGVEVVLQNIEVAVVGVGDLGRNCSPGDLFDIVSGYIQGSNHRVQAIVHALDDLAEVALVLGSVGACGQLAIYGGLRQQNRIGDQRVDGLDAGVEVVLQNIEVAVVGVGDLGRNVAPADPIDIIRGYIQRPNHRVQAIVHALHDLAIVALMLRGVGARGQLAVHCRLREQPCIRNQRIDRVDACIQVVLQNIEVAVVGVGDFDRNVALADPVYVICRDVQRNNHGVKNPIDSAYNLGVRALELLRLAAFREMPGLGGLRQLRQLRLQPLHHLGHVVDGNLHLFVVALVVLRNQFVDLAARNLSQDAVTFADG